eukprot:scaffold5463_cov155-Skeletonema_marinoi.AAC.15
MMGRDPLGIQDAKVARNVEMVQCDNDRYRITRQLTCDDVAKEIQKPPPYCTYLPRAVLPSDTLKTSHARQSETNTSRVYYP